MAGQYAGNFRPEESGAYEVPDCLSLMRKLEQSGFVRVGESGLESKDTTFAERDLQMLAKITGGEYLHISDFDHAWEPFAENLPTLRKRKNLADAWPVFIALFLADRDRMDHAKTGGPAMKNTLYLFWASWIKIIIGQVPLAPPPLLNPVETPETNAPDSNQVPQPIKRSSQLETIKKAEMNLRHGEQGERVGAAKLLEVSTGPGSVL